MFRSILVPLDGSAYSAAALPVARTVATATGSAIQLLRVVTKGSQTENNQAASYLEPIGQELRTDVATIMGLLVFSAVSFAPLAFFVRGATSQTKRTR